ncbi:MAG: type II secretion system F family protein [Granulosicoccus sp.]
MNLVVLLLLFVSISLIGYSFLSGTTNAWNNYSEDMERTAAKNLRTLFLFANTRRLLVVYVLVVVMVPVLLFLAGQTPVAVLLAFAGLLLAPRYVFARLALRRRNQINQSLPNGLAQIAGAMRAGSTFTSAVQSMVEEQNGPLGQEFSLLIREQRLGARMEEALDNLGERVQTEEMDLVIAAALIAQEVGGNLAEILQRLSETIRSKLEMEGKIKSLTAQGVLQGRVVTLLPFMILAVLMIIEPEATRPMFTSLLGWCFLLVIVVFQFVGSTMIRKIVRIEI